MTRGILLALAGARPDTKHTNDLACVVKQLCKLHIEATVMVQSESAFGMIKSQLTGEPCSGVALTWMPLLPPNVSAGRHGRVLRKNARDVLQWRHFKVSAIQRCPYSETLYLDNDVWLRNASRLLGWFDRLGNRTLISGRRTPAGVTPGLDTPQVPSSFPEINSGTLFLRCPQSRLITDNWRTYLETKGHNSLGRDQKALRIAMYEQRAR